MNSVSNFFKSLLPFVIIMATQVITSTICTFVYVAYLFATHSYPSMEAFFKTVQDSVTDTNFLMASMSVYSVIGILIFTCMYSGIMKDPLNMTSPSGRHYPSTPQMGHPSLSFKGYKIGFLILGVVLIAVSCQYLANYIVAVDYLISPDSITQYTELMQDSGLGDDSLNFAVILYAVILGPICEEMGLRAVTLGYSSRFMPFWAANVFQAFLFGLIHMNFIQFSYAFALGLVLGWIYHKTGNILVTMLVHITFNGTSTFLSKYLLMGQNPITFCAILLLSLVAAYCGMKLIDYSARDRFKRV